MQKQKIEIETKSGKTFSVEDIHCPRGDHADELRYLANLGGGGTSCKNNKAHYLRVTVGKRGKITATAEETRPILTVLLD